MSGHRSILQIRMLRIRTQKIRTAIHHRGHIRSLLLFRHLPLLLQCFYPPITAPATLQHRHLFGILGATTDRHHGHDCDDVELRSTFYAL